MSIQIENLILRYEEEISYHDCQEWESQLLEEVGTRKLNGLVNVKKTKLKTELIDVDLVRGSTFPKSKTRYDLKSMVWFSILAIIFFPFKSTWWIKKTNVQSYFLGCGIFCSMVLNLLLYRYNLCSKDSEYCEKVTPHELYEPVLLFVVLAFLQCHIVSPIKLNLEIFQDPPSGRKKVTQKSKRSYSTYLASETSSRHAQCTRSASEGNQTSNRKLSFRKKSLKSNILDSWHDRITSGSDNDEHDNNTASDYPHHDESCIGSGTHSSDQESDHESLIDENEQPRKKLSNQRSFESPHNEHTDHESGHESLDSGTENPKKLTPQSSHIVSQIGCTIWNSNEAPSKIYLSSLEIGNQIFKRSKDLPDSLSYAITGLGFAVFIALLPLAFKYKDLLEMASELLAFTFQQDFLKLMNGSAENISNICMKSEISFDKTIYFSIIITSAINRLILTIAFFFLLSVAERAFKRRFLTAKLFSHITSTRRSMKSKIPHFRLYKVRNIKAWLCVRAFLRRRGPQRSIDCIVSTAFMTTLINVSYLCYELLQEDDVNPEINVANCEVIAWCVAIGIFLIRYMTLASKINQKYRNLSVLLTEQINLYLQMELKPHKKEQLLLANNVLKLSSDLLKELETPFKINGLSANPFLYNCTRVLVLSAVSGVLSEMLGFKLKLYKVKIK